MVITRLSCNLSVALTRIIPALRLTYYYFQWQWELEVNAWLTLFETWRLNRTLIISSVEVNIESQMSSGLQQNT